MVMRPHHYQTATLRSAVGPSHVALLDTHGSKVYCIFQSQTAQGEGEVLLYVNNVGIRSYSDLAAQHDGRTQTARKGGHFLERLRCRRQRGVKSPASPGPWGVTLHG
jgi:hypothetical protein